MAFPSHDVSASFSFPLEEEKVLAYWKEINAFQTSLKLSQGREEFSFYDGPPFATGLPHYGHLLAGTIKDIVTRHAHATGFHVERRFGWDTHGLPVEHEINKKFNIKSSADVFSMGIDKYNAECRAVVMRYSAQWRETVERMGRWIDFDNDYKTLDTSFMESVWWVFSQLYSKGLVYGGTRVMPFSTALNTPLSNFEADQDKREVNDPAIIVSFPLVHDDTTSLLAWTTTPWTLPSNLALCVNPDFVYVKIHDLRRNAYFIVQEDLLAAVYKGNDFVKIHEFKGSELGGWKYTPMFDYYFDEYKDRAFRVVVDKFPTKDQGTGIVHLAPAFGEDDYRVAIEHGIIRKDDMPPCPVNEAGYFTDEVAEFAGQYVKDADKNVQKAVKQKGRMIVQSTHTHICQFCPRSGTQLIQKAIPAWFVSVEGSANRLVQNNQKTLWVPQVIGDKRFANWLANARDWNIARDRYWGTPIPLWISTDKKEVVCVGSIEELEKLSSVSGITDLHRENIDQITIPSRQGRGQLRRVSQVFDCWFESGSMPYAQVHYPFGSKERFQETFPADFVSEGIDQTRGWFYSLLVISTLLYDTAPWKNLIVHGLVLAENGKKMSKSLKNFPDPNLILQQYGADAVRLFLVTSPVVRGENVRFRESAVRDIITRVLLPWLNSYRFFIGQAALLKKDTGIDFRYNPNAAKSENIMDRWILARCQSLIKTVREEMGVYRLYTVVPRLLSLVEELTNWYIRFNRRRLKGEQGPDDTIVALNTLCETLLILCRTMSSFTPFITENLYQGLRSFLPTEDEKEDRRSVHFLRFPEIRVEYFDEEIERKVGRMQAVIELARTLRERHSLPLKTPLRELRVFHDDPVYLADIHDLQSYVRSELNIQDIAFPKSDHIKYSVAADFAVLGRKLKNDVHRVKNALPNLSSHQVKVFMKIGTIKVDGIELVAGDLVLSRYVDLPPNGGFDSNTDNDVVVALDVQRHVELEGAALARDLVSKVQKLRKGASLQPTDDVDIFYHFEEGDSTVLEAAILSHADFITSALRSELKKEKVPRLPRSAVVIDEEQMIGDVKTRLSLVRR